MQNASPTLGSEITPELLFQLLDGPQRIQLIDVRSVGEFKGQRIATAVSVPLDQIDARVGELNRNEPVVCICQSGGRSLAAQKKLQHLGFSDVSSVTGGMSLWAKRGFAVVKDHGAPWALERQVRVGAGTLILVGATLGWWVHPAFFGLSAFVGAGLLIAGLTDWCGMGLLLARAPWNR